MYVNGNYQFIAIDGCNGGGGTQPPQETDSIQNDTSSIFKDVQPYETEDNSTKQLTDLYEKLSNAKSEEEAEAIRAEIKFTLEEYNYDDDEILESLGTQSESIRQSYTKNIEELKKELNSAEDSDTKEIIQAQIQELEARMQQKIGEIEIEKFNYYNILPEEQTEVMSNLFNELANTTTEADRERLQAEIKYKMNEYGITGKAKAICLETLQHGLNVSYYSNEANLYEKLSYASGEEVKERIKAEIHDNENKRIISLNDIDLEIINAKSTLPDNQKKELSNKYYELSNAKSEEERQAIMAEINYLQNKFGLNKDESLLCIQAQSIAMDTSFRNEISSLYKELANCNSAQARDKINAEIKEKYDNYNNETKDLNIKYYQNKTTLTSKQSEEIADLCRDYIQASSKGAKLAINSKIREFIASNKISGKELTLLNDLLQSIR